MEQVRHHGATGPTPAGLRMEQVAGDRLLPALGAAYDDLAGCLGLPVTSRRPWYEAWCAAHPEIEPWGVLAWRDDRLEAAVLLGRRWRDDVLDVVGIGHGRNDRSRFPSRDAAVAAAVADGVVHALAEVDVPWELRVEQLPVGDAVAEALSTGLPGGQLHTGGDVPCVSFRPGDVLDDHLSKNLRRQLRKCRNRMADDGIVPTMEFVRDRSRLLPLLDEVEAVHRGRDHAVGRRSDIDDPIGLALWRGAILRHIEGGVVEIAALRVEGRLAAYVVSILDGDAYRVLDGRFDTTWEHYSPGRLLETATLAHAMEDPRYVVLDWMNSVAPDKLIAANCREATVHLTARSAPAGPALVDGPRPAASLLGA